MILSVVPQFAINNHISIFDDPAVSFFHCLRDSAEVDAEYQQHVPPVSLVPVMAKGIFVDAELSKIVSSNPHSIEAHELRGRLFKVGTITQSPSTPSTPERNFVPYSAMFHSLHIRNIRKIKVASRTLMCFQHHVA
mmetsp:Transcript_2620/g.4742  ORF Transcript_2620/g.4742 Transcript_2620/m.4742 type:complete len:136 (-) Transcript_2620:126-533(-)